MEKDKLGYVQVKCKETGNVYWIVDVHPDSIPHRFKIVEHGDVNNVYDLEVDLSRIIWFTDPSELPQ